MAHDQIRPPRARFGFTVKQIVNLLQLWQDHGRASANVKPIALDHVRELQQKRQKLDEMI